MADKKITELSVSQTIAADDSVFANIGGSARQVAVSLILALIEDVYATLESPDFTGSPTAPTPADTDDSTRVATTAFVKSLLEDYAKLASPTFTGTPKAPTASTSTNTTQIATTAYVKAQKYATLASPTLTGTPKTSTPVSTDDSTRIPTTAWVKDRIAEVESGGGSGEGGTFIIDITECNSRPSASQVWSNIASGKVPILYTGSAYCLGIESAYAGGNLMIFYYVDDGCGSIHQTYTEFY